MLKRTTGRLLLTSLVITGLAGTLNNSSLSQKERKQAISLIRSSRNEVLKSVDGLSSRQLSFKTKDGSSISKLMADMVAVEKSCNEQIKTIMKQPANAENRLQITMTDEQLLAANNSSLSKTNISAPAKAGPANIHETVRQFITLREHSIRYMRTSTEDLRNHVVSTPAGWIDCYQYYLLLADESSFVAQKIDAIKSSPGFPGK